MATAAGAAAALTLLLLGAVLGAMYGTPVLKGTPVLACRSGKSKKTKQTYSSELTARHRRSARANRKRMTAVLQSAWPAVPGSGFGSCGSRQEAGCGIQRMGVRPQQVLLSKSVPCRRRSDVGAPGLQLAAPAH